jgi:hypothetical protein
VVVVAIIVIVIVIVIGIVINPFEALATPLPPSFEVCDDLTPRSGVVLPELQACLSMFALSGFE